MARLAALVPKPRAHLTRYHGVFTPASPDRAQIVPSAGAVAERSEAAAIDRRQGMFWAQRLKRVFAIDIETCRQCGGRLRLHSDEEQRNDDANRRHQFGNCPDRIPVHLR